MPRVTENVRDSLDADRVAQDHYLHWALVIGAGAYAWQVHGFFDGIAVLLLLLLVIGVSNLLIMFFSGSLRLIRLSRWSWLGAAYVLVAISGASGGSVG